MSESAELQRVLILADSYPPNVGGAERGLATLVAEVKRLGIEVIVAVPRRAVRGGAAGPEVRLAPARRTPAGWLFSSAWMRSTVESFSPQVVQSSGPSLIEWGALWARRSPVPMVSVYNAHLDLTRLGSRIANWAHVHFVLPRFDAVVTVSPRVAADLRRWKRGLPPLQTITPGILGEHDLDRVRTKKGADVLFVGRLPARHAQKRPDLLLEAFSYLLTARSHVTLHVVGEGPGRSNLERLAGQLGVASRTVFHGYLPQQELDALYEHVGCLVLPSPSRSEGFGLVMIEAISRHVPVVLAEGSGGANVVPETGCGYLFRTNDPRSLADALERTLLENEQGRFDNLFGPAARLFLAQRMAQEYVTLWSRLASQ